MTANFNPIKRARDRRTRKNAINAMCAHCVGCTEISLEQGFKDTIKACTSVECPLYRYRPYQSNSIARTSKSSVLQC
jgi:hypothetical protein